jgi:hypothetical protein
MSNGAASGHQNPSCKKSADCVCWSLGGNDMDMGLIEAEARFSEVITNMGKPLARRKPLCENSRNRKDIVNRLFDYQRIDGGKFDIKDAVASGRK